MEIIDQHTKKIMEECKARAKDAGLRFDNETLEYIVTNKDMLGLSPKVMIPTLYDYWVHDVDVLKEFGKYKVYPHNPYETVINSRPAISFYNDNNPDWLNIMIFYHVIAHIDFFQNNALFKNTWNDDFVGKALADKRSIAGLRNEHGRWVDYVIEFSRSIDNICGYFSMLASTTALRGVEPESRIAYYFGDFLQDYAKASMHDYCRDVDRYNELLDLHKEMADSIFLSEVKNKYSEFPAMYEKYIVESGKTQAHDLLEYIREHSPFLQKEQNRWMKAVMNIIRNTALYFGPQIRTKICNEGWASYWHDKLFMMDDRIKGHEVGYAKINAGVTSISRVGLNPYAIGLRLMSYIEELADKGKISWYFQKMQNIESREKFDKKMGKGNEAIYSVRSEFSDFMLLNTFIDQDFLDMHNLFVVGKRLDQNRGVYQYYVKSRKAEDYKQMLIDSLYHPPKVVVNTEKTNEDLLYVVHKFEGKQLVKDFIPETLIGIEFLWGGKVQLETTEIHLKGEDNDGMPIFEYKKVLFSVTNRKVTKENIE